MRRPVSKSGLVVFWVIVAMTFPFDAQGVPNTKTVQVLCNGNTYSRDDPFKKSVDYVEEELIQQTPANKCDYKNISPFPVAFAYGHATCNSTLSPPDAQDCLNTANKNLHKTCGDYAVGARIRLVDCSLRYENYPFSD